MNLSIAEQVVFHDHKPKQLSLYDAVIDGFSKESKSLPPKFFYDERGSHLFDQICNQPEYYLPTIERRLLLNNRQQIIDLVGKERVVIEPGAGSLAKIRLLLDDLQADTYVPMDISADYLQTASNNLAQEYSELDIHAVCVDFTHSIPLPNTLSDSPRLVFFPGSSLGNLHYQEARRFLSMIQETIGKNGLLLIGVDTKKHNDILHAAYNDVAGVTAEFNLNLLHRIDKELDSELEISNFDHHAFYNSDKGRIEMHLISLCDHRMRIGSHDFQFKSGETIHTECSYKYTPEEFLALAKEAKLQAVDYWLAENEMFGMYLLKSI